MTDIGCDHLLVSAADGDQRSWEIIVARHSDLVWSVARSFRLGRADAADVCQATWLRLLEHLRDIRDSDRLSAWLATTARREALAVLRRSARTVPTGEAWRLEPDDASTDEPDSKLLRSERARSVRQAFEQLPESCQQLLRIMLADPPPSYADVSAALGMATGSIGPARARCLDRLRQRLTTQEGSRHG
jgi:RNA polymerase sigma factor (sigma-70 family)